MPITGNQKATTYAQFGAMRFGASRFGYHSGHAYVSLAGVQIGKAYTAGRTLVDSLTITDVLDETPNTCSFTVMGITPDVDDEVLITLGSVNNPTRLFAGHVLQAEQSYAGTKPSNIWHHVSAIDYTHLLGFTILSKRYTNQSATAIAQDLITSFTTGFTVTHVAPDLPVVDEITFTNEDLATALTRLKERIGAYWYVDYLKDLHFFLTETSQSPMDLTETHPSFHLIGKADDGSQRITRVSFEGGGVNALMEIMAGETILPVQDAAWYNPGGGVVVSGPQRVTYTSLVEGNIGTLVGPGVSPATAPTTSPLEGAGLSVGVYKHAYSFVTAAGESLPSPLRSVITSNGPLANPLNLSYANASYAGNLSEGYYGFAYTFVTGTGETLPGSVIVAHTIAGRAIYLLLFTPGPAGVIARKLYRTTVQATAWAAFTAQLKLSKTVNENTTDAVSDGLADGSLGANAPTANTTTVLAAQVAITAIAIGGASVTQRKVYRTVVGGTQLKLLTTIADNTATTYTDAIADASLGANAPTGDTSGLSQPNGQVLAGSTSMLVAGAGNFSPTGGLVVIGNGEQVVRYTGISGNTLTGVPTSGPGSITATVTYNSSVTAAPALIGIPATGTGSIQYTILEGDPVNLLVIVDDLVAQSAIAAKLGGSGVIEESMQDRRLSETEARARAQARLDLHSATATSLRYRCRDLGTKAGSTVTINLGAPTNISGAFKIQRVTIGEFDATGRQMPTFSVEASNSRYSFEDLLRRQRKSGA